MDDEGRLSQEAIEGIVKKQRGGKRLRSIKTLEKIHTKEEIEGWIRQAVPVVERVLQQEFPGLGIQPRPIASETLLRLTILPLDQAEADEDSSVAAARPEEVERDAARILERSRPYNLFLDEFDSKSLDRLLKPTLRRDPKQYDLAGRIIAQILEYSEERRRGEFRLENLSLIERVVLHSVVPVLWKLGSSAPLIRSRIGADREHVLVILRGQMDDQRWLSQEAIERIVEKQRGSKQLTAIRALEEIHTKGEIEGWIRQAVPPVERALQRMFPELGIQPRPIAPETLLRLTILPLDRAGADEDASVAAGLEAGDPIVEGRLDEAAPAVLAPLLEQLSHPERKVLHMRFGLGGEERKHTLQEVGQHPDFRVSRERIRKIQWEALRKLAHWRTTQLEAEYLSEKPEAVRTRLSRPLDTLKLSIRSRKVVERALAPNRDFSRGITLRDLVLLKEEEILSAVEYPKTPFDDIRQKVQELGFRLGMHPDELPPPATEPLSGGSAQSGLEAGRRGEGDNGPSMLDVLMGFVLGVPVGAGLMYSVTERDRLAQPPARVIPQETPAVPQVAPAQPPAEEAPQESGLEVSAAGLWLDGYAAPDGRIVPDAWITSGLAAPGQSRLVLPISAGLDHGTHLYLQQGLLGEALVATLRLTPGVEVTEFMLSDIPEVDPSRNNVFVAAVQYDSPSEDRMRGYGSALVNLYGSSARRPWSPAVLATLVQAARQSDGLLRVGAVTADERVGLVSLGQAA
ncbi:MAG: hypothetical protein COV76_02425 [Candidatus Omnitrophica bacterium CG11_big_fil_rev_8_21_14_0_20_64_10]|nr:MAG: hypothetical protein COV76_02425 [Candidatus Omnitrophica bacterium CG11_big_fil_rev_8_21_14_0_20_64_10]